MAAGLCRSITLLVDLRLYVIGANHVYAYVIPIEDPILPEMSFPFSHDTAGILRNGNLGITCYLDCIYDVETPCNGDYSDDDGHGNSNRIDRLPDRESFLEYRLSTDRLADED